MWCIYKYNGILQSHQKGWTLTIYIDVDGNVGHYTERNKSITERQLSYCFIHMGNIRNSA